ncbi:MAG: hypothetical protein AAGF11_03710 [Myxococcota bacterium]
MHHATIHAYDDPKLQPVRDLLSEFEQTESATSPEQRRQVVARARQWGLGRTPQAPTSISPALQGYADKCARFAYKVTDEEVDALKATGTTETALIEITLAASLGVSLARLEQGLMLLGSEDEQ